MLTHIRVLDLTDERGLLCGRLLADLGADVVQVEPLRGSTARSALPVTARSGRSLFWETYAANKRGLAVDLDSEEGVELVRRLAVHADVVVTSMPAAWLRERGLDPDTLRARSPQLVYTVISAFGWSGPKADYADSDLVVWAAGGPLEPHRDGERPPLRISVPQAFLHASADAAGGAMLAVLARRHTGRGQVVDVSAQASLGVATLARVLADAVGDEQPEWHRQPAGRTDQSGSGAATPAAMKKWRCRDGMIELHLSMGSAAGGFTNNLFRWLHREAAVDDEIASWDWRVVPDLIGRGELSPDDLDRARAAVRAFLLTKTKAEVVAAALEYRLLCMAIFDVSDVAYSEHFEQRGFWGQVEIDGRPVRIPGRFAQVSEDAPSVRRPAPALGEHTDEVLREWLGTESCSAPGLPAPPAQPEQALAGLKVLDLSWVVAGPLIGRALADFGAEVVRVESSARLDTARLMQPFHGGVQRPEHSALFGNCNAGKLGMTIDLKTEAGRAVVKDLAEWADVVVESFSPGQLAKWGLDYDSLLEVNPSLIMLSTSIAGQTGPWSALAGYGNVGSSLSGFQHLVGWPDSVPLGPFGPYTDYLGPRLALVTLLAAIEIRHHTGRGRYIDVAQVEAGVYFLSPQVAHFLLEGAVAQRRGNADDVFAPHGVYPCVAESGKDRFVAIVTRTDEEWRRLARLIDRLDLAARPELDSAAGRREHADELDAAIGGWTRTLRACDVEQRLQEAGIPAHLAASSHDFVTDPQLRWRGHIVRLDHQIHGATYVEAPRYLLSETPGVPGGQAPTMGQHNEMVLTDLLGYHDDEIKALVKGEILR